MDVDEDVWQREEKPKPFEVRHECGNLQHVFAHSSVNPTAIRENYDSATVQVKEEPGLDETYYIKAEPLEIKTEDNFSESIPQEGWSGDMSLWRQMSADSPEVYADIKYRPEDLVAGSDFIVKLEKDAAENEEDNTVGYDGEGTRINTDCIKTERDVIKTELQVLSEYTISERLPDDFHSHSSRIRSSFLTQIDDENNNREIQRDSKCDVQGEILESWSDPRMHSTTCYGKPFRCEVSQTDVSHKENFGQHSANHTRAESAAIEQVKSDAKNEPHILNTYELKSERELTECKALLGKREKYRCQICGIGFPRRYMFREHMVVHSPWNPFICDVCGESFKRQNGLLRHKHCVHSKEKSYKPLVGGETIKTRQSLVSCEASQFRGENVKCQGHEKSCITVKSDANKKCHICDVCGADFRYKGSKCRHRKHRSGLNLYGRNLHISPCTDKHALSHHKTSHSEESRDKKYKYEKFRSTIALKQLRVPEAKKLKSETFGKNCNRRRSPRLQNDKYHVRTGCPFRCHICDKSFMFKYLVIQHMVSHSSERPFVCDGCGKGFKYKQNVEPHKVMHCKGKLLGRDS